MKKKNMIGSQILKELSDSLAKKESDARATSKMIKIIKRADEIAISKETRIDYENAVNSMNKHNQTNEIKDQPISDISTYLMGGVDNVVEDYVTEDFSKYDHYKYAIQSGRKERMPKLTRVEKVKFWFKYKVDFAKHILELIEYWAFNEYEKFRRLQYLINKEYAGLEMMKKFDSNRDSFVKKFGYVEGTKKYIKFCQSMNKSIEIHNKLEKVKIVTV